MKKKFLSKANTQDTVTPKNDEKKLFQSRFLNKNKNEPITQKNMAAQNTKNQELSESSSEEETDSEEDDSDTVKKSTMAHTDIGPLLARSANARDSSDSSRKNSKDDILTFNKNNTTKTGRDDATLKNSPSRGVANSDANKYTKKPEDNASNDVKQYSQGRYVPYKERKLNLARSKSSHVFADDDDIDDSISPTSSSPNAYLASKGYSTTSSSTSTPSSNDISRSRSTHALKSRETSPEKNGDNDGSSLSSWARYLKSKYGNR